MTVFLILFLEMKKQLKATVQVNVMRTESPTASLKPSKMNPGITMQTDSPTISLKPSTDSVTTNSIMTSIRPSFLPTVSVKTSIESGTKWSQPTVKSFRQMYLL